MPDLQHALLDFALLGAGWVLWLLVALLVASVAVAIERGVVLALSRTPASSLQEALQAFLRTGDAAAFAERLGAMRGTEARVLLAGLQAAEDGAEAAEEAMAAALAFEKMRLERAVTLLGTVGANAPFIGLFGTVLGIIKAFHDLASQQAEAASAVMAGISEALVATAIGLMVAIPAVILFNVIQRRIRRIVGRSESFGHLVLARLKARASTEGDKAGDAAAFPERRAEGS